MLAYFCPVNYFNMKYQFIHSYTYIFSPLALFTKAMIISRSTLNHLSSLVQKLVCLLKLYLLMCWFHPHQIPLIRISNLSCIQETIITIPHMLPKLNLLFWFFLQTQPSHLQNLNLLLLKISGFTTDPTRILHLSLL